MEIKQILELLVAQAEPSGYFVWVKELEPMSKEESPLGNQQRELKKLTCRDLEPSGCGPTSHMYGKPLSRLSTLFRDFSLVSFLEISLSSVLLPVPFPEDRGGWRLDGIEQSLIDMLTS